MTYLLGPDARDIGTVAGKCRWEVYPAGTDGGLDLGVFNFFGSLFTGMDCGINQLVHSHLAIPGLLLFFVATKINYSG